MKPKMLPRIMVLVASAVVALEAFALMGHTTSARFEGLGLLSARAVSTILFQIVILSCIVGALALVLLLDKDGWFRKHIKLILVVSFVLGVVLSVEGLVAINLNGSVLSGTTSLLMICIGLELYTLGILSMVSYVQNENRPSFFGSRLLVSAIVFVLLLLPPAIIMA